MMVRISGTNEKRRAETENTMGAGGLERRRGGRRVGLNGEPIGS